MDQAPRVFMSYASEDSERFVLDFARRLRGRHIDVWLDRWEILPGDKLVDKVFKAIGEADAIIIVLSKYSVNKPWVKEELDAAVVKRIETGCRLIPVILDNCVVPDALKATAWVRVDNPQYCEPAVDRIVAAIFGHQEKPELGSRPAYTATEDAGIPGFSKIDFLVLREFSRKALEAGDLLVISTEEVWDAISKLEISRNQFRDSCKILSERFMLEKSKERSPDPAYYSLTEHGLDHYLRGREPEFWEQFNRALYVVVNEEANDNGSLAAQLGVDRLRARLILLMMKRRQYVRLHESFGGHVRITEVRPELRRKLEVQ